MTLKRTARDALQMALQRIAELGARWARFCGNEAQRPILRSDGPCQRVRLPDGNTMDPMLGVSLRPVPGCVGKRSINDFQFITNENKNTNSTAARILGLMRKPTPPLRWAILAASREFGCDRLTLTARLRAADILPGDDGKYSTKQIVAAIAGDRQIELTGKTRAEREYWELRVEEIRRTRIPIEVIEQINNFALANVRGIILASRMTDQEKQDIFAELRGVGEKVLKWKEGDES